MPELVSSNKAEVIRLRVNEAIASVEVFCDHQNCHPHLYEIPSEKLTSMNLREGDRFWIDTINANGEIVGRIRPESPPSMLSLPERFLTPDELERLQS